MNNKSVYVPDDVIEMAQSVNDLHNKSVYVPDDVIEMAQSVNDLLIELARFQKKGGQND